MSSPYRESFKLVPETCPHVDNAADYSLSKILDLIESTQDAMTARAIFTNMIDEIKTQTNLLREALVKTIAEKNELIVSVESLESEIESLKDEVYSLKSDIQIIESEKAELEHQLSQQ